MNNLFIMRNHQTEPNKYNYVLFDSTEQTKANINVKPIQAKKLVKQFNIKAISPLEAWSMFNYKQTELGMFLPLPF